MDALIQERHEQPLLQRVQISGQVMFEGSTPSKIQLIETLGKELKVDTQLLVLKHIYTEFGYQRARFMAYLYQSTEARQKYETVPSHLKKKAKSEKPKAK